MPKLLCFVMSYRRSRISVAPKRLHHRRDGTGRDANERIEKKIEKVCPTPTYPTRSLTPPCPPAHRSQPAPPGCLRLNACQLHETRRWTGVRVSRGTLPTVRLRAVRMTVNVQAKNFVIVGRQSSTGVVEPEALAIGVTEVVADKALPLNH